MLEHCARLLQRDVRKPVDEFANLSAIFQVLKKSGHRHAGTATDDFANSQHSALTDKSDDPNDEVVGRLSLAFAFTQVETGR